MRYPDDVVIGYRHFPLEFHPLAIPAAQAAECAGAQGHFDAYHDLLFSQKPLGVKSWQDIAMDAGISDTVQFNKCMRDSASKSAVTRDKTIGDRLGVQGTPTLLINGQLVAGNLPLTELEKYVHGIPKD